MKAETHLWTSLLAGGAIALATKSPVPIGAALIGGFAIDADHLIDQVWSNAVARRTGRNKSPDRETGNSGEGKNLIAGGIVRLIKRRPLLRLPLVFHSYELLLVALVVLAFYRTPFIEGLVIGYALHLSLDWIRHHHEFQSPMFYLIAYRASRGFDRNRLIKPEYL